MSYKIVVDSCCDLTDEMKGWKDFEVVPLTLEINDYRIPDDNNFNQDDFINRMKANGGMAKSCSVCLSDCNSQSWHTRGREGTGRQADQSVCVSLAQLPAAPCSSDGVAALLLLLYPRAEG